MNAGANAKDRNGGSGASATARPRKTGRRKDAREVREPRDNKDSKDGKNGKTHRRGKDAKDFNPGRVRNGENQLMISAAPGIESNPPQQHLDNIRGDVLSADRRPQPLRSIVEKVDSWDAANQQKMSLLERRQHMTGTPLQALYEQLQKMREEERREMENRGLVDRQDVRKALSDALIFTGTCKDMCPVFERVRRSFENNVMAIERDPETGRVTSLTAVKAFSRPAAGQPPPLPSDVRPPSVLTETLDYLVVNALPKLPSSHAFLWDRTRSIRQDFTYQNYSGPEAIRCTEIIVRIHLITLCRMAWATLHEGADWSQQQEMEQLNKSLQSLSEFYGLDGGNVLPDEPEFRAYQLVSHLWDPEIGAAVDARPREVADHPIVKLAREFRSLAAQNLAHALFVRVGMPDVPPLLQSLMVAHFNKLRMTAARQLMRSLHHRSGMYPLGRFRQLLAFDSDEDARNWCAHYDVNISSSSERGVEVDMKSWSDSNVSDKMPLNMPAPVWLGPRVAAISVLEPQRYVTSPSPADVPLPRLPTRNFVPTNENLYLSQLQAHDSQLKLQQQNEEKARIQAEEEAARQRQAQEARLKLQEAQKAAAEARRREEERQEAARRAALEAQERARRDAEARAASAIAAEAAKESRRRQREAEQRRQQEAEHAAFVDEGSRAISAKLLDLVVKRETENCVTALTLNRQWKEKLVALVIKDAGVLALRHKHQRQVHEEEFSEALDLLKHPAPGRVSSRRFGSPETNTASASSAPIGVSSSQGGNNRQHGASDDEDLEYDEDGLQDGQCVNLSSVLPALRRVAKNGLKRIEVQAEWRSAHGWWVLQALGLELREREIEGVVLSRDKQLHKDAVLEIPREVNNPEDLIAWLLRWLADNFPEYEEPVESQNQESSSSKGKRDGEGEGEDEGSRGMYSRYHQPASRKRSFDPSPLDSPAAWRGLQRRSLPRRSLNHVNVHVNSFDWHSNDSALHQSSNASANISDLPVNEATARLKRLIADSYDI